MNQPRLTLRQELTMLWWRIRVWWNEPWDGPVWEP